jgi:hypothetical protein
MKKALTALGLLVAGFYGLVWSAYGVLALAEGMVGAVFPVFILLVLGLPFLAVLKGQRALTVAVLCLSGFGGLVHTVCGAAMSTGKGGWLHAIIGVAAIFGSLVALARIINPDVGDAFDPVTPPEHNRSDDTP